MARRFISILAVVAISGTAGAAAPTASTIQKLFACRQPYLAAKMFTELAPAISKKELATDEAGGWSYSYDPAGVTAYGLPVKTFSVSDYLSGGDPLIDIEATVSGTAAAAQRAIEKAAGRPCVSDDKDDGNGYYTCKIEYPNDTISRAFVQIRLLRMPTSLTVGCYYIGYSEEPS